MIYQRQFRINNNRKLYLYVLKNHMSLEHSRHRSPVNFLVHVLACLTGYAIKKSTLKLDDLSNSYPLLS